MIAIKVARMAGVSAGEEARMKKREPADEERIRQVQRELKLPEGSAAGLGPDAPEKLNLKEMIDALIGAEAFELITGIETAPLPKRPMRERSESQRPGWPYAQLFGEIYDMARGEQHKEAFNRLFCLETEEAKTKMEQSADLR